MAGLDFFMDSKAPPEERKTLFELLEEFAQESAFLSRASDDELFYDLLEKPRNYWETLLYLSPEERADFQIIMFQDFEVKITPQGVFYKENCIYEASLREESTRMRRENEAIGLGHPWEE